MNLKELLELTKEKKLEELGKDGLLPCGVKSFRGYLKNIGCEPTGNGQSGWNYGKISPELLETELTDLVPLMGIRPKAKNKKEAINSNIVDTNKMEIREHSQDVIEDDIIGNNDSNSTKGSEGDNKMTKDVIEAMFKGIEPKKPKRKFKGYYLEEDVIEYINRVPEGNRSEFVNSVIRMYLKENGLI